MKNPSLEIHLFELLGATYKITFKLEIILYRHNIVCNFLSPPCILDYEGDIENSKFLRSRAFQFSLEQSNGVQIFLSPARRTLREAGGDRTKSSLERVDKPPSRGLVVADYPYSSGGETRERS